MLSKYWKKGWISFLISASAFIYLLKFTWLKWGDIIIDTGRDAHLSLRICSGEVLYRDIFCFQGPFSHYFNAFLFKALGAHLNVLILNGIITAIVTSALIYRISRVFLSIFYSIFTVLTFLFVFAFGYYVYLGNYNFILPYHYGAIHSICFSLAALYLFYRAGEKRLLRGGRYCGRYAYGCVAFIILTGLAKLEIGAALLLSVALGVLSRSLFLKINVKKLPGEFLLYACLPAFCILIPYALFILPCIEGLNGARLSDFLIPGSRLSNPMTLFMSGADDVSGNSRIALKALLSYFLLSLFFVCAGLLTQCFWRLRLRLARVILSLTAVSGAAFLALIFLKHFFSYRLQFRPLPVICLFLILAFIWRIINEERAERAVFGLVIAFFSLFLVFRMFFAVWAGHYGFYLVVPGLLVYHIFFFRVIPDFLKPGLLKRFFRLGFLAVFILFIFGHLSVSRFCYQRRSLMVQSPGGSLLFFNNDKEKRCKELVEFLQKNTAEDETLVVVPEGLLVNFLSGRRNPLYYYDYLPIDLSRPEIEESVILSMEKEKVDYVALVQRDIREHGAVVFGGDYAQQLFNYINEKYFLYKQFGPFPYTSSRYGAALFKRKK